MRMSRVCTIERPTLMESTPRPGLRAVVEQAEFDGEGIRLLALRDEEIDAAGVVVETRAVVRGQFGRRCAGR